MDMHTHTLSHNCDEEYLVLILVVGPGPNLVDMLKATNTSAIFFLSENLTLEQPYLFY